MIGRVGSGNSCKAGLHIRNTIRTISNAAKQVCAAICLQRFCARYGIAHEKLDLLIEHLWAFASITSPSEFVKWDETLGALEIDDEVFKVVETPLLADFRRLVSDVQYVVMCNAYAADTDEPVDLLIEILSMLGKHNVATPPLETFTPSVHNAGWGMPVDSALLDSWRLLNES